MAEPESKPALIITDIFNLDLYIHLSKIKARISDIILFSQNEEEDNLLPLLVGLIKSKDCLPDVHITAECSSSTSINILFESGVHEIFNAEKLLHRLLLSTLVNSTFQEFIYQVIFQKSLNAVELPSLNIVNSIYSIIKVVPPTKKYFEINETNFDQFDQLCQAHSLIPICAYICINGHFEIIPIGQKGSFKLFNGDSLIVIAKNFNTLRSFEVAFKNKKELLLTKN
jgi:hypothetical protein